MIHDSWWLTTDNDEPNPTQENPQLASHHVVSRDTSCVRAVSNANHLDAEIALGTWMGHGMPPGRAARN